MRSSLFSQRLKHELQGYRSSDVFQRYLADKTFSDPLRMVQYLDFKTYLPGDILTKVDRASMAHGLEVRTPFLDYELVEWTARLPTALKLKGFEGKHILKTSLEPYLPHEVLYRSKMGFAVPLDIWFRGSLKDRVADAINSERLADSGLFDQTYLRQLLDEHHTGRRNHSAPLWTLLMFDGFLAQVS
jgi:asparagine synthase (glutamine-hydrolysing)